MTAAKWDQAIWEWRQEYPKDLETRVTTRLETSGECLVWPGQLLVAGYGHTRLPSVLPYRVSGRPPRVRVHRVMWIAVHGVIDDPELEIDHLCKNRRCARLDHLELTTSQENILRGDGLPAYQAQQVMCVRGHLLVEGNLVPSARYRQCLTCQREHSRRWNQENRAKHGQSRPTTG